jgi:preprotein translocase subunit SecG
LGFSELVVVVVIIIIVVVVVVVVVVAVVVHTSDGRGHKDFMDGVVATHY